MTPPSSQALLSAIEATWPSARRWERDGVVFHDGAGGGKRVSAARARHGLTDAQRAVAEREMQQMGQAPLFMLTGADAQADDCLARSGYDVVDPTRVWLAPVYTLTDTPLPPVTAFCIWEPLAIMHEIWEQGGICAARRAVMARAKHKTGILLRNRDKPAGVAFVARHGDVAMVHALEILPEQRRQGVAGWAMRAAAFWARASGADWMSVLCTEANGPANALYASLGFEDVMRYHYRKKRV